MKQNLFISPKKKKESSHDSLPSSLSARSSFSPLPYRPPNQVPFPHLINPSINPLASLPKSPLASGLTSAAAAAEDRLFLHPVPFQLFLRIFWSKVRAGKPFSRWRKRSRVQSQVESSSLLLPCPSSLAGALGKEEERSLAAGLGRKSDGKLIQKTLAARRSVKFWLSLQSLRQICLSAA